MRKRMNKVLIPLFALAASVFASGCSLDKLGQNVWIGFGRGLGAIPADVVGGYLVGLIDDFITPDNNEG